MTTDATIRAAKKLIASIARNAVPEPERADAELDAQVWIWQHNDEYDAVKYGAKGYRGWLIQRLRWAMIDGLRIRTRRNKQIRALSLDATTSESGLTIGDTVAANNTDDPETRVVASDAVRIMRRDLTADDAKRRVGSSTDTDLELFEALLSGQSAKSYADDHGVTESRISQRVKKMRERFRWLRP
jgi:hypothetical protein